MQRTNDKPINLYKILLHTTALLFLVLFFGLSSRVDMSSQAALLSVHNHVTNDTFNYSRAEVRYEVNGTIVSTDFPGLILSNGAAVGPCRAVFEDALGIVSDYEAGKTTFRLQYGTRTIQMTLGNTEALVDGTKTYMNNAPFVYSFNGSSEKYLYVPSRFVAETFGFVYQWNSSTQTATITRPNVINDGNQSIQYTDINPVFSVNETEIVSEIYPGYVFNDVVFFSAEEHFQKSGVAAFAYAEGSGLIVIKNTVNTVRMILGSPVAYINDSSVLMPEVPRLITPKDASAASVYIPAEFTAKALGLDVSYNTAADVFEIIGDTIKQNVESTPSLPESGVSASDKVSPNTESFSKVLFTNNAHKQVYEHYTEQGYNVPHSLSAYACLNSDALYLKGVDLEHVTITDKHDILEINISDYRNPFDGGLYYNPEADFLNYCYIGSSENLRLLIIKANELHYYMYPVPDGCVIHFTNTLGLYLDQMTFTIDSDASDNSGASEEIFTDLFTGVNLDELIPETVFSREHYVIPLPENITPGMISDEDLYSQKKFTISIPGNHLEFLSEQNTYNPIDTLESVQFNYKASDDSTVITFKTSKIQGYSITVSGGYLGVRIDNPSEIYDKIIVLDAGHGGIDPGTLRGSLYEKTVNFNVVNIYAAEYFKDSDIKVYYTRTTDTKIALQTRANFAATVGADLFISFHVNASSYSSVSGTSVYYSSANNNASSSGLKSSVLAKTIADKLSLAWNTRNRGILTEKFVVIHNNTVPAVLVECGYITNDNDFEKIKSTSYQKKAAKALYEAVTDIFEQYPTGR